MSVISYAQVRRRAGHPSDTSIDSQIPMSLLVQCLAVGTIPNVLQVLGMGAILISGVWAVVSHTLELDDRQPLMAQISEKRKEEEGEIDVRISTFPQLSSTDVIREVGRTATPFSLCRLILRVNRPSRHVVSDMLRYRMTALPGVHRVQMLTSY